MSISSEVSDDICAYRLAQARTQPLPQSLLELQLRTPLVTLSDTLEELALRGTQFETALISTQNTAALITGQGGYGRFMNRAQRWRPLQDRVNLRVGEAAGLTLSRSDAIESEQLPLSVVAADANGKIVHRVQAMSRNDVSVASAIEAAQGLSNMRPPQDWVNTEPHTNIVPFTAIRKARETWNETRLAAHLNDLLIGNGKMRQRTLPHIGRHAARRIRASILPSFLSYLCDRSIGFSRAVVSQGIMQAACGKVSSVSETGELLIASGDMTNFVVNTAQQNEVWMLRSGSELWIECYSAKEGIQSVLLRDPMQSQDEWRSFLSSLPSADL